ncbi:YggS family pyridoxal phosphate-dependent enzyme, partial [Streptomyces sp. NPDC057242]
PPALGVRLSVSLFPPPPPPVHYAGEPREAFGRLMDLSTALRATRPAANMVSAGMSGDLEEAVAAGATHVRVGTAVLGVRPKLG